MALENRDPKPGTKLVARYKGKDHRAEVVQHVVADLGDGLYLLHVDLHLRTELSERVAVGDADESLAEVRQRTLGPHVQVFEILANDHEALLGRRKTVFQRAGADSYLASSPLTTSA